MSARRLLERWLGAALAASLWIGFAPAPAPGLNAAEIAAIWGSGASRPESTAQTQPHGREQLRAPSAAPVTTDSAKDSR
jgi:hypothetical protein